MNTVGWHLLCAGNLAKHFIFHLRLQLLVMGNFQVSLLQVREVMLPEVRLHAQCRTPVSGRAGISPRSDCTAHVVNNSALQITSLRAWILKESISGSLLILDIFLLVTRNLDQKAVDSLIEKTLLLSLGSIVFQVPTNMKWSWDLFFLYKNKTTSYSIIYGITF